MAAAACLFPLTENLEIARSTGTRHRAALGLTDETDATVVVVSEETGRISIAQNGVLRADVPVLKLEAVLREALGKNAEAAATGPSTSSWTDFPRAVWKHVRRDWLWIAASLLLGAGTYSLARLQLLVKDGQTLHLTSAVRGSTTARLPGRFELVVLTPSRDVRVDFEPDATHEIEVLATPGELSNLVGAGVRGTLDVSGADRVRREISLDEIRWEPAIEGVTFRWSEGGAPILNVSPVQTEAIPLTPELIAVDDSQLNPRFIYGPDSIRFEPPTLRVEAPAASWSRWRAETAPPPGASAPPIEFETIAPPRGTTVDFTTELQLSAKLRELGFVILSEATEGGLPAPAPRVSIEFQPAKRRLDVIEKQIALVSLDPSRADELAELSLPVSDQTARFAVYTTGLIPANAEPGSPVLAERTTAIMEYLERNLRVFADISALPRTTGQVSVSVQTIGGEKDRWSQALENFIPKDLPIGELEGLELRLETAPEILLDRKSN